ncbi:MAG TPA: ATP-binding protein [Acidobacteriaceae bacterium]|nr:ATP-binding protein [Acidobacteriaceae bacterium]
MTTHSRPGASRRSRLLVKICGYLASVLLPWIGVVFSIRTPALHGTPLALNFVFVAGITLFTGLGPGILSVVLTALTFNHLALARHHFFSLSAQSVLYSAVILAIGFLIAFVCDRQRTTSSDLRAALASLRVRTNALVEAQQASNFAAWMHNADEGRIEWAEGGSEIFGRPFSSSSVSDDWTNFILEEDRARVLRTVEAATSAGQTFRAEFRVRWPNGELHWLETRGTPSAANPRIWHGVTIDITDRKNAELALVRSEKLAAIGRLSATIAHEVNNPLEAVTNLIYLARSDPHLAPETSDYLLRADQELARLGAIARRTLTFVRSRSAPGPVSVAEVIDSVVALFQPRCAARSAEICVSAGPDFSLPIPADDLRQILTNLVSNACDALPDSGGRVRIETALHGAMASIAILDNGAGIPPENLPRIFDPFFTTKSDVGTGIGLWVSKDLVEKNGGHIAVESGLLASGFHTLFRVELPVS